MTKLSQESGQALLIAILVMMLLLISIPTVVFMNRTASEDIVHTQLKDKTLPLAQEGLDFAVTTLAAKWGLLPGVSWPAPGGPTGPFNGNFPSQFGLLTPPLRFQVRMEALTPFNAVQTVLN